MASSTLYQGWGRSTWSDGSFGTPILKVSVDGVQATGSVGSVSVVANANAPVTGLEATGSVGSVTVKGNSTHVIVEEEEAVSSRGRWLKKCHFKGCEGRGEEDRDRA